MPKQVDRVPDASTRGSHEALLDEVGALSPGLWEFEEPELVALGYAQAKSAAAFLKSRGICTWKRGKTVYVEVKDAPIHS